MCDFLLRLPKNLVCIVYNYAVEDDFGNLVAVLQKINIGYESVYERDSILNFNKGILISETIKDNKK